MLLSLGSFGDGRTLEYVKFVLPSSWPLSGIFNGGWLFCRDPSFEVLKRMATDNCGALINCARCRDEATLEWMVRYSIYTVISFCRDFVHQQYRFEIFFPIEERGGGRIFMKVFTAALWWPGVGSRTTTVLARAQGPASECEGSPVTWNCRRVGWGTSVSWLWKSEFSWTWWCVFYSFGTGLPVFRLHVWLVGFNGF